jgi:hypothetical protein
MIAAAKRGLRLGRRRVGRRGIRSTGEAVEPLPVGLDIPQRQPGSEPHKAVGMPKYGFPSQR